MGERGNGRVSSVGNPSGNGKDLADYLNYLNFSRTQQCLAYFGLELLTETRPFQGVSVLKGSVRARGSMGYSDHL